MHPNGLIGENVWYYVVDEGVTKGPFAATVTGQVGKTCSLTVFYPRSLVDREHHPIDFPEGVPTWYTGCEQKERHWWREREKSRTPEGR